MELGREDPYRMLRNMPGWLVPQWQGYGKVLDHEHEQARAKARREAK